MIALNNSKNKYLLKNTVALAVGNFGSKLITFLLVPLYTNILSLSEYGTVDLITVLTTVLVPIITLNVHEAVMRFMMDKDSNADNILSVGLTMIVITLILCIIMYPIFNIISITSSYSFLLIVFMFSFSISNIFLCYIRGKEKLLDYSIIGIIQSLLIAGFNIYFLVYLKTTIKGYIISYILAYSITSIICVFKGHIFKKFHYSFDLKLAKSMLKYSVFLIPNSMMWWIINSLDRFMVTSMISIEANGIYSVSYKIPTILITLTTIFNQAWMFSAIKENENTQEEKSNYTNIIYSGLFTIVLTLSLFILLILKPLMKIYVGKDFYMAWQYTPLLIIGVIFLTLGTFISNEYTANKDSFGFLKSSFVGSIINLILNFIMIPKIGAIGAAIATCISYISIYIFRYFDTKKYVKIHILDLKKVIGITLLIISSLIVYLDNSVVYIIIFIALLLEILLNLNFWKKIVLSVFKLLKIKRRYNYDM